ncbi:MAG: flagellar basal body P-ring formation chaperone FlgA [Candidatus Pacebacteria bacterium]|nr:flagellar basal body P-ring formation chaperone FlgA [Candidatus Paceibacterota bacterium]
MNHYWDRLIRCCLLRRFQLAAMVIAVLALMSNGAELRAAALSLNGNGFTDSDQIRLKDIWSNLPDHLANHTVQPAPPVGQRVLFDQNRLVSLASQYRLDWQSRGRTDRLVIERSSLLVSVPIMLRPMSRGAVIAASDIGFIKMAAERIPRQTVTDTKLIVGKTAIRDLAAAQPIRSAELGSPTLVMRNSPVTVALQNGKMSVMMMGTALDDGSEGQLVRVLNTSSKKIIQGTVRGLGLVVVASYSNQAFN